MSEAAIPRGIRVSRRAALQWAALLGGAVATSGALASCAGDRQPPVGTLRLATGPTGAVYREMGAALAALWDEAWGEPVVEVIHTDAAVDNLALLDAGQAELGFVNVDVLAQADTSHRALLRIFDSVLQLVVAQDSPIWEVGDLAGAVVAAGLPGSGTRFTTRRLMEAVGLTDWTAVDLAQDQAADQLRSGEVDAMFSLTAMPTPAITDLIEGEGQFRFIDLADPLQRLHVLYPQEYLSVSISGAVYPGVSTVTSPGVASLLVTAIHGDERSSRGLTDEVVRFLAATVIEGAEELRTIRPEAAQINTRTAAATTPIALHPAAADYFRSIKP